MRDLLLIATILFFLVVTGSAQERVNSDLILIHGIVLDASSQEAINSVHYSVNGLGRGSTDAEGKFSIYLSKGDTIRFSFLGYRDIHFATDTLPGNSYVAGIFMQTDTVMIGEVVIFPRLGNLRSEFASTPRDFAPEMVNAQNNITISAYQGINSSSELGEPAANYELLRRQQTANYYEKGGIPSDKMLGLNLISLIPVSAYLLANGLPEKPAPPKPHVSSSEVEKMKRAYRESTKEKGPQR